MTLFPWPGWAPVADVATTKPEEPPIVLRRCMCGSLTERVAPCCGKAVCPRRECLDDHRKEHTP